MQIFQSVPCTKGHYELATFGGMGLAPRKDEGSSIVYDSYDQEYNKRYQIYLYAKACRFTHEHKRDNLYEDLIPRYGKEIAKALAYSKDTHMANIFNNCVSAAAADAGPDGLPLGSTAHTTQAGPTSSNRLSPDMALSEDALEQAKILMDNFLNPDGLQSETNPGYLIVPVNLQFTAERILSSKYKLGSGDNDPNVIGSKIKYMPAWKRLSSTTRWFLTSDRDYCFMHATREPVTTIKFNDNNTFDSVLGAYESYRIFFGDWRGVVVSNA
jgi:hypothetical protein